MRVGVPSEVKQQEYRVAITPAGVQELVRNGHTVVIQAGAGRGSSLTDEEFEAAGASILPTAEAVWGSADMIVKVKEPLPSEYGFLREDLLLFTYLHLAASRECTEALLNAKTTSIAYETVELPDRTLPLLAPMSEVAGRLAPQVGAQALLKASGVEPASPAIAYCNSGHLAAGPWFVMSEIVGNKSTRLYDGSLYLWTLDKRPLVSVQ